MKNNTEFKSKMVDGVVSFIIIFVFLFIFIIMLVPAKKLGIPGYLTYGVLCLGISTTCLHLSKKPSNSDIKNAWLGIVGGLAAWTVQEVSGSIGWVALEDGNGLILFLLMTLTIFVLWSEFSIGPKFWFAMFLFNWSGHILLKGLYGICILNNPIFCTIMTISAYISAFILVGAFIWIFIKSSTRISRLWAANIAWLMATIIIYVIKGW